MKIKKIVLLLLTIALFIVYTLPAFATDSVDELEGTTSDLENELSNLNSELSALNGELDALLNEIQELTISIEETKAELAAAKGNEEAQYEAMTLRIKYMYENGNTSVLEMLLSSGSIAEFLNHAEYYASIMEYDRAMLEDLETVREEIAAKEQELLDTQNYLSEVQTSLLAKEEDLNSKIASTSADLSVYTAKLEAARIEAQKAEEAAKEEVIPIVPEAPEEPDVPAEPEEPEEPDTPTEPEEPDTPETPDVETPEDEEPDDETSAPSESASDLELFAALIECEAGTSDYEGMLAVASVVVNRMNNRHYPDTLRGVIFQSGQFPPATNGLVDRVLERGINQNCLTAAQDALNGKNNVGDCLQFRSSSSGHVGTIIGSNVFF